MLDLRLTRKLRIIGFSVAILALIGAPWAFADNVIYNGGFEILGTGVPFEGWAGGTVYPGISGDHAAKLHPGESVSQTITEQSAITVGIELPQRALEITFLVAIDGTEAELNVQLVSDGRDLHNETITLFGSDTSVPIPISDYSGIPKVTNGAMLIFTMVSGSYLRIDDVALSVEPLYPEEPTKTPGPPTSTPTPTGPTPTPSPTTTPTPENTPSPQFTSTPTLIPTPAKQPVARLRVSANPNYLRISGTQQNQNAYSIIRMRALRADGSVETSAKSGDFNISVISGNGVVSNVNAHDTQSGVFQATFSPDLTYEGRVVLEITYSGTTTSGSDVAATVGILVDRIESKTGTSIPPPKKNILYQRRK